MSNLNLGKLKEEEVKLNKRGGDGGKNWLQLSKAEEPIDFRILDPLPSMDGLYYVEVPTWWINGKRLISKKLFGPEERDVVEEMKLEAEEAAKKDKTLAAILAAKKGDIPLIQFKWEYWVPGLQFKWDINKDTLKIEKIFDAKNNFDVELIKKYIVDGRVKIAIANITILKAINVILTNRVYLDMLTPDLGSNIQIKRTGQKRDTKYSVLVTEKMPMPKEFYSEGKMTDPFEVAQSLMYTDAYMELVMGNYLYGDVQIPADVDSNYEFPEIRTKLKDKFKEAPAEEEKLPVRQRPGRGATPAPADTTPVSAPAPAVASLEITQPSVPESTRPSRPAGRPAGRPGRRNIVSDLKATQE